MPKRNVVKIYGADEYYHVYNRGVNKLGIFCNVEDYWYFIGLFKRHLSDENVTDRKFRDVKKFDNEIELVAFCIMPNHFHLLCFLKEPEGLVHLMRSVMTAYTMYFNKKYKRTGKLCEGAFLAARIDSDDYLWQVSRYIHLNPMDIGKDYRTYPYSSLPYYSGDLTADWIKSERLIKKYQSDRNKYLEFVEDYAQAHKDNDQIKHLFDL
jgi:REP element-mobilizing transposase RayT